MLTPPLVLAPAALLPPLAEAPALAFEGLPPPAWAAPPVSASLPPCALPCPPLPAGDELPPACGFDDPEWASSLFEVPHAGTAKAKLAPTTSRAANPLVDTAGLIAGVLCLQVRIFG